MKINQKGFTLIEVLLAALAVSVISFAGYYVYNAQKSNNDSAASPQTNTKETDKSKNPTSEALDSNEGYYVIKEWGVRMKLPSSLSDLEYTKDTEFFNEGEGIDAIDFTSKSVKAMGGYCGDKTDALGRIVRYAEGYKPVGEVGGYNRPPEQLGALKVGNNYYLYISNKDGCVAGMDDASRAKIMALTADLKTQGTDKLEPAQ